MSHEITTSSNEQEPNPEQLAEQYLIAKVGSAFHEQWRETRRTEDGTFEPREKTTSDQAWIEVHGADTVDIANTSYDELPEDWKGENKAAAEFVVGLHKELTEAGVNPDLQDPAVREHIGDEIHNAWLSRNEWAKDGDLGVAFGELPIDEQEKDLDQFRTLLGVMADRLEAPAPEMPREGLEEKSWENHFANPGDDGRNSFGDMEELGLLDGNEQEMTYPELQSPVEYHDTAFPEEALDVRSYEPVDAASPDDDVNGSFDGMPDDNEAA